VDFKDKQEFWFAGEEYPSVAIVEEHPLLRDFHEPNLNLYVAGTPHGAAKLASQIDQHIQAVTDGWRTLACYAHLSPKTILAGGHGLFMRAPESICVMVTALLGEAGIAATTPGHRVEGGQARLLLLGDSYVVAGEFGFQRQRT
jgi:hypothetical protein